MRWGVSAHFRPQTQRHRKAGSPCASRTPGQCPARDSNPEPTDLEEFGIGGQFSLPIANHLELYPSLDYFFVDPGSFWSFNGDLKYRIATESVDWLYVGGGLNIARRSGDSRAGINLLAGFESLSGRVHPFGEFRFTANDGSTAQASAGLNFTLSSS